MKKMKSLKSRRKRSGEAEGFCGCWTEGFGDFFCWCPGFAFLVIFYFGAFLRSFLGNVFDFF